MRSVCPPRNLVRGGGAGQICSGKLESRQAKNGVDLYSTDRSSDATLRAVKTKIVQEEQYWSKL